VWIEWQVERADRRWCRDQLIELVQLIVNRGHNRWGGFLSSLFAAMA
jgi:hypothetical protein